MKFLEKSSHCQLCNDVATIIKPLKNKIFEIHTATKQVIQAKKVLIAAGAQSQNFIDQFDELKRQTPLVLSSVGCAMLVKANDIQLESVVRTPGRAGSCGIHMLPRNKQTIYLGATAYFSRKSASRPSIRYLYNLQRNIIQQFNKDFESAEILHIYNGNRPVTIDAFPLIGSTCVDNLWLLTGTYRDGLHNSPLLGPYMASQLLENNKVNYAHPFAPNRKPIQMVDQAHSINKAIEHLVAAFYDYDASYPV
ncbi:MAG: FAD-binding oxidoreductase, partial [Gammaproteobacteria bacterium]|nr:FAD-binding oxidoreductase [Gammaproteobacteria bacterium]